MTNAAPDRQERAFDRMLGYTLSFEATPHAARVKGQSVAGGSGPSEPEGIYGNAKGAQECTERFATRGEGTSYMFLAIASGLVIDWTQMPTYNTIMSIAAGAALMSLVYFARALKVEENLHLESWALAFVVPGLILTVTGIHMSLTWPFAKYFPYDNIIFGETSFGFGVLLLAAAFYLWKRGAVILASGDPARYLAMVTQPLSLFIIGMGLALVAIAAAGLVFQLFAAPPEEPISGAFAAYPWIEATFMSGMFGVIGIGAVLCPLALRGFSAGSKITLLQSIIGWLWGLGGLGFFLFGALNFFTHIGLIVHTMH